VFRGDGAAAFTAGINAMLTGNSFWLRFEHVLRAAETIGFDPHDPMTKNKEGYQTRRYAISILSVSYKCFKSRMSAGEFAIDDPGISWRPNE
jgi:hypothetical protein